MSTYEYKCRDCGHSFEINETIHEHEKHKPQCPKCQCKKVEQLISSFFAQTGSKT